MATKAHGGLKVDIISVISFTPRTLYHQGGTWLPVLAEYEAGGHQCRYGSFGEQENILLCSCRNQTM
jgi:hypothetical protein